MYPTSNGSAGRDGVILTLPFFENPIIQESQKPRWTKHDLLGRNGQMFTFTGAQSRRIKLTFNMTFPHILKDNRDPIARYIQGSDPAGEIRDSMRTATKTVQILPNNNPNLSPASTPGAVTVVTTPLTEEVDDFTTSKISKPFLHGKQLVTWWVNVIRSSTVNNGRDPSLGPPIVMLKHGPLYKSAKFICEGYNISFDEEAGYELDSLLNRRIVVSMDLAEVKFGENYYPGAPYAEDIGGGGDAVTGWQHLIDYGVMDPDNDEVFVEPLAPKNDSYWGDWGVEWPWS